jgi:diguanylate cyclase (GGDEF)-like protein
MQRLPVEWGGLLRKVRTQDSTGRRATPPAAPEPPPAPPEDLTPADVPIVAAKPTTGPLLGRRSWASGAFLAAAARLVARGEETGYTLRRVVEWATAATGARHAVLWAVDREAGPDGPLAILAWAATDGWRPGDAPAPRLHDSPALLRASRTPETTIVEMGRPNERGVAWLDLLGAEPIAVCAAVSGGETRGILAVAGTGVGDDAPGTFGEDARAALAACAALAAIVFERQKDAAGAAEDPAEAEPAAPATAAPPAEAPTDDPFLALPSREAMLTRLGEEIKRAGRFGHPLALLTLDVDRFEDWEERAGAEGAATMLGHLVRVVRASTRDVDLLGRDDRDGLILILPVSEVDDALRVGERVRATLAREQPEGPAIPADLRLTVSGGAVGYPDDGETAEDLLAAAERTTAYAKRMGRDQIRLRGLGDMESPRSWSEEELFLPDLPPVADGPRIAQVFQGLLDALTAAGDAHDQARPGQGARSGATPAPWPRPAASTRSRPPRWNWRGRSTTPGRSACPTRSSASAGR